MPSYFHVDDVGDGGGGGKGKKVCRVLCCVASYIVGIILIFGIGATITYVGALIFAYSTFSASEDPALKIILIMVEMILKFLGIVLLIVGPCVVFFGGGMLIKAALNCTPCFISKTEEEEDA